LGRQTASPASLDFSPLRILVIASRVSQEKLLKQLDQRLVFPASQDFFVQRLIFPLHLVTSVTKVNTAQARLKFAMNVKLESFKNTRASLFVNVAFGAHSQMQPVQLYASIAPVVMRRAKLSIGLGVTNAHAVNGPI
jgi:hypothetical protein